MFGAGKSELIGKTVKYKLTGKTGVIIEGYKVDNPDSLYTDVFKVMYSDKSVEVLILHQTASQYEQWQIVSN